MKFITIFLLCTLPLEAYPSPERLDELKSVMSFTHKDHHYLLFGGRCVVHDPDCECQLGWRGYMDTPHPGQISIYRDCSPHHD